MIRTTLSRFAGERLSYSVIGGIEIRQRHYLQNLPFLQPSGIDSVFKIFFDSCVLSLQIHIVPNYEFFSPVFFPRFDLEIFNLDSSL